MPPKPSQGLTSPDWLNRWLPMVAVGFVVAYFFSFIWAHALNIPHHDGIIDFLQFLVKVETADSVPAALREWLTQYNDHRTSATRMQVYLAYLLQGEINFHTLALLANLSLPLILGMLYLAAKEHPYRLLFLLSSALLLLHIRTYTIVLWSQPAFAYCYVFTYAFACLFALHKVSPAKLALGAIFCTLASLTLASAQTVWLFGLVSLAHQSLFNEKRSWAYPAIWLSIAIVSLAVWRYGFVNMTIDWSSYDPKVINDAFPGLLLDPTLKEAATRYSSFFLVMLGSAFSDQSTYVAGATGLLLLGFLVYISVTRLFEPDIRLILCCWFIVGSAAAITYGRSLVGAPEYILHTRYSFISVLFVASMAMLIQLHLKLFRGKFALAVTLVIALLSSVYSVWVYQHFQAPLDSMLEKRHAGFNKGKFEVFGFSMAETNAIIEQAIALGIYKPPCRPQPDCTEAL